MTITVLHNQSLLDVSIQHTGSVFNAFKIAVANGLSVSDSLIAGSELMIPNEVQNDDDVLNYYRSKNLQPATAIADKKVIPSYGGIGWMQIENDFKVS